MANTPPVIQRRLRLARIAVRVVSPMAVSLVATLAGPGLADNQVVISPMLEEADNQLPISPNNLWTTRLPVDICTNSKNSAKT
jgi:hypothetical protein